MKFTSARIYTLSIPFRMSFAHSLQARKCSRSVVVALNTDSGVTGYGEGAPRSYVTGEDLGSCVNHIRSILRPALRGRIFQEACTVTALLSELEEISNGLPAVGGGEVIAYHAAKCSVELAIVDGILQNYGLSAGALWPPAADSFTYSIVIGSGTVEAARAMALHCWEEGIKHIKIKVGGDNDYARVAAVRDIVGDGVSLRLDANGALDLPTAVNLAHVLEPLQVDCIEQPFPRDAITAMAEFRRLAQLPVMADESLVTSQDADQLIERCACDLFNLRISKNGGLFATLALAAKGRKAGIRLQLGCQVGETAILSAAGRHLAAHIPDLCYVEGSYGDLLLSEDISQKPVNFGHGGGAGLLTEPGLGICIQPRLLDKYCELIFEEDLTS